MALKAFRTLGSLFKPPLGPKLNISNTLSYVSQAYQNVNKLVAIAIGNEPDLYSGQYNVDYTIEQFVCHSKTVMSDVQNNLGLEASGDNKRIFEVLDFAAGDTSFKLCVFLIPVTQSYGNMLMLTFPIQHQCFQQLSYR